MGCRGCQIAQATQSKNCCAVSRGNVPFGRLPSDSSECFDARFGNCEVPGFVDRPDEIVLEFRLPYTPEAPTKCKVVILDSRALQSLPRRQCPCYDARRVQHSHPRTVGRQEEFRDQKTTKTDGAVGLKTRAFLL